MRTVSFVLVVVIVAFATGCAAQTSIAEQSRRTLVALYAATGGPTWRRNDNWNSSSGVCTWYGVTCLNGLLAEIDLTGNNATGSMLAAVNFTSLTTLQLFLARDNGLSGQVPVGLFYLPSIARVDLRNNRFTTFPMTTGGGRGPVAPSLWITLAGNSIWCPVPEHVVSLGTRISDWNATQCVPLVSRSVTEERTETLKTERPVLETVAVAAFTRPIAGFAFNARDAIVYEFQLVATAIMFEILSRPEPTVPQSIPPPGSVPTNNSLFTLEVRFLRDMPSVLVNFTVNVTEARRRDLANRIFSNHESVLDLGVTDIILFGPDGAELSETNAPVPTAAVGEISRSNTQMHIIVSVVLLVLACGVVLLFVCLQSKRLRDKFKAQIGFSTSPAVPAATFPPPSPAVGAPTGAPAMVTPPPPPPPRPGVAAAVPILPPPPPAPPRT